MNYAFYESTTPKSLYKNAEKGNGTHDLMKIKMMAERGQFLRESLIAIIAHFRR